ncbi:MBL fold metallo-hydrolase [Chryseobacterium sp. MYb264]|uniref:MBL fold metallo-hydrolase n=1 Tax=Chryseobacterium sp. MYb264 TaxID=2745153 RepID=UPI002E11FC41|nr:MBL fold metallo-hydrolase [Chryseobacterium sp. MYb264]
MKVIPLKEGDFFTNNTKEFTLLTNENWNQLSGIKMSVQPFLIITEEDYILLDGGIGWKNEKGQPIILQTLEKENIYPHQITKILLSHLHKDHIEGIINKTESGFEPNFPNAEIFIQKRELDFARSNPGNYSFDFDTLEKMVQLPNIVWMHSDDGNISRAVSYQVVGGHTPFMQVFWIKENNYTVFYGADNLPQESYLKYHVAYKSDFDGKKAMRLRQQWQAQGQKEHWKVLLYHDLEKTVIQL